MQYMLSSRDLEVVLALARGGTLARASSRLEVDASTVFRLVQRIEKGLGQRIFERTSHGYLPTDLGLRLLQHAEVVESELQAARGATHSEEGEVSGLVRISAVDAVLNALVVPALAPLLAEHPLLRLEFRASNELANLTRRDTDIVLRSTNKPPPHLVGRQVGTMHFSVYASKVMARQLLKKNTELTFESLASLPWISVDEAMPEHPGVLWRKRYLPSVQPVLQVNSMLTAAEAIEAGIGVGVVANFHAQNRPQLAPVTATLVDCEIGLWLLTHQESRHLRRIALVVRHLAQHLVLTE
ncbi:MAG: LysR family transcriptional regulator [Moraxellaceae bacterium]|nr:LysR family transcriptional regulator [Moraxellaceae bacterium]MDZ4386330.1 LysR family transcriptional regulator [Moraxellaceae bacterium]